MSLTRIYRKTAWLAVFAVLPGCASLGNIGGAGREAATQHETASFPNGEGVVSARVHPYDPIQMAPQSVPLEGDQLKVYSQARMLLERGRHDAAIVLLSSSLQQQPEGAVQPGSEYLLMLRGICHASRENYETAHADLSEAIQRNDQLWQAYFHRGMVRHALNRPTEAQQDQDTGRKIAPEGAWIECSLHAQS